MIEQSEAILFLQQNRFVYDKDYEAYQAIDLAREIKRKNGIKENDIDKSKNFDNVFTKNDHNIMRRKSIHRVNFGNNEQVNHLRNSDIDIEELDIDNEE